MKNRYSFPLYTKYTSNFMNYCAKQAICNRNCTHTKANKQTNKHTHSHVVFITMWWFLKCPKSVLFEQSMTLKKDTQPHNRMKYHEKKTNGVVPNCVCNCEKNGNNNDITKTRSTRHISNGYTHCRKQLSRLQLRWIFILLRALFSALFYIFWYAGRLVMVAAAVVVVVAGYRCSVAIAVVVAFIIHMFS